MLGGKKESKDQEKDKGATVDLSNLTAIITSQCEIIKAFNDKLDKKETNVFSQILELKSFFNEHYEKKEEELKETLKELAKYKNAWTNVKKEKEDFLHDKDEQIKNLDSSIKEKDKMTKKLQDEIQELQKSIMSLSNENGNLSQKLSDKDSAYKKIENEYDSLKRENLKLKDNVETYKTELGELKISYAKDGEKIKTEFNRLKAKIENYETLKIDKLEKAYSIFLSFKERTRNNLKAVFETDSFLGFISNSMQWERIAGVWEQAKRKIVNDDNEDLSELRELFLILFEAYNAGYSDAPYSLINPSLGSNYNSNEQLIKNQKSDGKITGVLLEGYVFKKNNTIHKAMIEVE